MLQCLLGQSLHGVGKPVFVFGCHIAVKRKKKRISVRTCPTEHRSKGLYSKYLRLASVKSVMVNVVGNVGSNGFCMSLYIKLNALKNVEDVV